MNERKYSVPPIAWLKVTDFMQGWFQYELGGGARVMDQKVVCVQHLPGARDVLRMETVEDMMEPGKVGIAMSARRKNCLEAGLELDEEVMMKEYGVTKAVMKQFVPVECPRMCLTKNGVLRPWTLDVCFGREQANAMQRLLRQAFWDAVGRYNEQYALRMEGQRYAAVDMVESFCLETKTPDMYVEAIRREWQRRVKRMKEICLH